MSNSINESLSALMDGEADDLEVRRLLKNLDTEAAATWQRYQLAASVMKSDKGVMYKSNIAAAVSEAIMHEKTPATRSAILRPILSFAVAASVSLALFVGLQYDGGAIDGVASKGLDIAINDAPQISDGGRVMFGTDGLSLHANSGFSTVSAQWGQNESSLVNERDEADALAAAKLKAYLKQHTAHSADNNNQGALPFARLPEQGK